MDHLFILSNSPGEVAGWVKPVAEALAQKENGAHVTLAVLPCPYASGMEERYGREIDGIDESMSFRALCRRRRSRGDRVLVLQLGGDPMFGAFLAAKFRGGWMIYTSRPKWRSRVTHYFIPDARAEARFAKKKVNPGRFTRVGNLALDSIPKGLDRAQARVALGVGADETVLSLLPGSRPFEYRQGFPFFARAAEAVMAEFPEVRAFMPVAPTVDEDILRAGLEQYGVAWRGDERVEALQTTNGEIRLVRGDTFALLKASDLAAALPGTNNLQMAAMGTPFAMFAPLNEAENIPLDGIPGILPTSSPRMQRLKKRLVFWYSGRTKYVSLPNILGGEEIVPEQRGAMTPEMIADTLKELLRAPSKREAIRQGYRKLDLEFGAAEKIAARIDAYFSEGQSLS